MFLGMLGLFVGLWIGFDLGQKSVRFMQGAQDTFQRVVAPVRTHPDAGVEAPPVGMMLAMGRLVMWGLWRLMRNAAVWLHQSANNFNLDEARHG